MGNAMSLLESVKNDLLSFDWFDNDAELDAQIASIEGVRSGSTTTAASSSTRAAGAASRRGAASAHARNGSNGGRGSISSSHSRLGLEVSNARVMVTPSKAVPGSKSSVSGRKRKESPNKGEMELSVFSPQREQVQTTGHNLRARGPAAAAGAGGPNAKKQLAPAAGVEHSNPFAALAASASAPAQRANPKQAPQQQAATARGPKPSPAPAPAAAAAGARKILPQLVSKDTDCIPSSSAAVPLLAAAHVQRAREPVYHSNARVTQNRLKNALSTRAVAAPAPAPPAATAPTTSLPHPLAQPPITPLSSARARPMASFEMCSPEVSYASKVSGRRSMAPSPAEQSSSSSASASSSSSSASFGSPVGGWVFSETAASRSSFYALSPRPASEEGSSQSVGVQSSSGGSSVPLFPPPPPPASALMTPSSSSRLTPAPAPTPVSMAEPLASVAETPSKAEPAEPAVESEKPQMETETVVVPAGLSAEVVAEAARLVAQRKAEAEAAAAKAKQEEEEAKAKAAAEAEAKAKAEAAAAAAAAVVPQAPPMDIPQAPPMDIPQAPPMAPPAPPLAPPLSVSTRGPKASPSDGSVAPAPSSSVKALKKFHWTAVPSNAVERDTLWAELQDDSELGHAVQLDHLDVERAFSVAPPPSLTKKPSVAQSPAGETDDVCMDDATGSADVDGDERMLATPAKKPRVAAPAPKITLLDAKRSYNLSISLARLRSTPQRILDAIVSLNPEWMDEESLSLLASVMPSDEECATLRSWASANPQHCGREGEVLAPVEHFVWTLCSIPQPAARVRLLVAASALPAQVERLEEWMGVVEQSCKEIRASRGLKTLLCIVLRLGNFLNASAPARGRSGQVAGGFRLGSLSKLRFTKSADGRTTLLHYLVGFIRKECAESEVSRWRQELEHVPQAAKVECNMVASEMKALRESFKSLETELARCSRVSTRSSARAEAVEGGDSISSRATRSMHEYLSEFVSEWSGKLDLLQKRHKMVQDITSSLARYFGEGDGMAWDAFFGLFADFMLVFAQAEEELSAREAAEKEEVARKERARVLRERLVERKGRGATVAGTPGASTPLAMDSSFADGAAFDFGGSNSQGAAGDMRRHTICTILPSASSSAGAEGAEEPRASAGAVDMDLSSPLHTPQTRRSALYSPSRGRGSYTASKLGLVREESMSAQFDAVKSPARASAAAVTPLSPVRGSSLLNTPLGAFSPTGQAAGQKRGSSSVAHANGAPLLTSPSKQPRIGSNAEMRSPQPIAAVGKENEF